MKFDQEGALAAWLEGLLVRRIVTLGFFYVLGRGVTVRSREYESLPYEGSAMVGPQGRAYYNISAGDGQLSQHCQSADVSGANGVGPRHSIGWACDGVRRSDQIGVVW